MAEMKRGGESSNGEMGFAPRRSRRRSASVSVGVVAVLAAALTGCSDTQGGQGQYDDDDYAAVCVDEQTELRVDDDRCDDDGVVGGGAYAWYYVPFGRRVQPVGSRVGGGSFNPPPPGQAAHRGVPAEGGEVSRGGFGGKSGSFGG